MKVFIVNLARRPDRLAAVKSGLPSEWLAGAEFTTHWPGPVDGSTIRGEADLQASGIALYDGWQQPESNNAFWNRPLKLGEIGCAYAHISVWQRAQQAFENDATLDFVMIFEDDAYAKDDTVPRFDTIMSQLKNHDWDLFYLGRVLQKGTSDGKTLFPGVVEPGFSYCLFGYILSRSGVKKLLQAGFDHDIIPVDEMVPASYIMHPRRDVARLYPPVLKAYAASPPLIFQRTKIEAGSDTETSKLWTAPVSAPEIVVDQARHLFDQIYYINLDSRLDRRQNFESLGLPNVTRFPALTPAECRGVVAVSDNVKKNIESKSRRLHREIDCWEQVACAQSHLTIWQKLVASTDNRWLIFEDDVVSGAQPTWLQKLEADYSADPFEFDLLFLNVMKIPVGVAFRPLNNHFEWMGSFWGMHAYIITRDAAVKLLADAYPISYQVDGYVATKLSTMKMAVYRHPTVVQNEARFGTDVQKIKSNLSFE